MALRIGVKKPAADPTQVDPTQLAQALAGGGGTPTPTDPDGDGDDDSTPEGDTDDDAGQGDDKDQKVDPQAAGYQGPDEGPFMCANCQFFEDDGPNTCAIVSGKIDHMGCCNNFSSTHAVSSKQDTGDDEGDADNMQQTGTSQPTTEPDEPEGT